MLPTRRSRSRDISQLTAGSLLTRQAPATAPAVAPAPPRRERDPWFDNTKMLLVLLVVVGHSWTLLPSTGFPHFAYVYLYLWHVPAFVMVTGYLSRRFSWSRRDLHRLLTSVVVPYVIFEALLGAFRIIVGGEKLELLWLNPHWPMWYLSVLLLWRLATPALRRLRHALPLSIAISLAGGFVGAEALDLNRALGLLPFFTAGLLVTPEHLERLRSPANRSRALVVLVLGIAVAAVVNQAVSTEWLYYRTPYDDLDAGVLTGPLLRLAVLAVGFVMAAAVLALVPGTGGWFTRLGPATLVVYLCHGFAVLGAEYAGVPAWAAADPSLSFAVVTAAAVVLALLLAWRPVASRLEKLVLPIR